MTFEMRETGIWAGEALIFAAPDLENATDVRRFFLALLYFQTLSPAQFGYDSREARLLADAVRNSYFGYTLNSPPIFRRRSLGSDNE